MLLAFLQLHRDALAMKLDGLDEQQARHRPTPQANSLLNLVVHMTGVERNWGQFVIAGQQIERDRDAEFSDLGPEVTVDVALAAYRDACAKTDEIVNRIGSLDETCRGRDRYNARFVVVHLIEETARHAGHADITRELIDGEVGLYVHDRG